MSLGETASAGNRLATLRALRDRLAADIDTCESARDKASLSLRLMDALAQIDAIEKAEPAKEATTLDEVAKRRAAKSSPRASRG